MGKIQGKKWERLPLDGAGVFSLLVAFLFLTGCTEMRLQTLPEPPTQAKLRVFVKAVTGAFRTPLAISHERFERQTYSTVEQFFTGPKFMYSVIPYREVRQVLGNTEPTASEWNRGDWALAMEAGRRLWADYVLIIERAPAEGYFLFSLINVETKKKFEVRSNLTSIAPLEVWQKTYRDSMEKIFARASEDLLATANRKSRIVASRLAATQQEIHALAAPPPAVRALPRPETVPAAAPAAAPIAASDQARIVALEKRLAALLSTMSELDSIKKQLETESRMTAKLAGEIAERDERERALWSKLAERKNAPPVIVIASPAAEGVVDRTFVQLAGVVEDDDALVRVEILVNGRPLPGEEERAVKIVARGDGPKRVELAERIPLVPGANLITVRALDSNGLTAERTLMLDYREPRRTLWAVVIGIDRYPNLRPLKYAENDARLFHDYLVRQIGIPVENVWLLLNEEATLVRLRSVLGTDLKSMAGPEDMVIIYFAGHGASEREAGSPDGDGLEKYLLPVDSNLKNLYATALPMEEIVRIFSRIRSERLIFIADACYSGASGGRTIGMGGMRASISDGFLDRVAAGKGRVIIAASGANEVSAEKDELRHGVFTYHLVRGLQGAADADRDGEITVEEAFGYVSREVPKATGQEQHPVMKGNVEGRLVLGIIQPGKGGVRK